MTVAGLAFQLGKGVCVGRLGALLMWTACGFVLSTVVPWQALLGAALVLAALATWVYLGEAGGEWTADE